MRRIFPNLATAMLLGCAGTPPSPAPPAEKQTETREPDAAISPAPAPAKSPGRTFSPPTELDRLLDAHPLALPTVKPATAPAPDTTVAKPPDGEKPAKEGTETVFQIQVDALSDIDAAQARKAVLEAKLEVRIDMIFDAPYYKLRFGSFATRREAEDKLVELAGKNLQGFIVRQ